MADPIQDVNASEPSAEEEVISEDELDNLEKEIDKDLEDDTDDKEEAPESEEPEVEPEVPEPETPEEKPEETPEDTPDQLREKLKKAEDEKANLLAALREKRHQEREGKLAPQVLQPQTPKQTIDIDPKEYVATLVANAENEAMSLLTKEYPELDSENDPDNQVYNSFAQDFALAANVKKIRPVSKEQFLELGRYVMKIRRGPEDAEKVKGVARTEAHKEQLKAAAVSKVSTRSSSGKPPVVAANDSDRRAAAAVNMSVPDYLKYKDRYSADEVPV